MPWGVDGQSERCCDLGSQREVSCQLDFILDLCSFEEGRFDSANEQVCGLSVLTPKENIDRLGSHAKNNRLIRLRRGLLWLDKDVSGWPQADPVAVWSCVT